MTQYAGAYHAPLAALDNIGEWRCIWQEGGNGRVIPIVSIFCFISSLCSPWRSPWRSTAPIPQLLVRASHLEVSGSSDCQHHRVIPPVLYTVQLHDNRMPTCLLLSLQESMAAFARTPPRKWRPISDSSPFAPCITGSTLSLMGFGVQGQNSKA